MEDKSFPRSRLWTEQEVRWENDSTWSNNKGVGVGTCFVQSWHRSVGWRGGGGLCQVLAQYKEAWWKSDCAWSNKHWVWGVLGGGGGGGGDNLFGF